MLTKLKMKIRVMKISRLIRRDQQILPSKAKAICQLQVRLQKKINSRKLSQLINKTILIFNPKEGAKTNLWDNSKYKMLHPRSHRISKKMPSPRTSPRPSLDA